MIELKREEAAAGTALATLFAERRMLRAVVDAVLEGRAGRVHVDDSSRPRVARLSLGCYAIFGGDPASDTAERLVRDVPSPIELLIPDDPEWRNLLDRVHGPHLSDRPMRAFSTDGLDPGRLEEMAEPPVEVEIVAFDAALAARLNEDLRPSALQSFDDPEHFLAEGMGYGALIDDALVCAATSYAMCSRQVEVAIATHPRFRSRGLAQKTAARMLSACLQRGLSPEWSAANPVSQRLAVRLGYRPAEVIEVSYLERPA